MNRYFLLHLVCALTVGAAAARAAENGELPTAQPADDAVSAAPAATPATPEAPPAAPAVKPAAPAVTPTAPATKSATLAAPAEAAEAPATEPAAPVTAPAKAVKTQPAETKPKAETVKVPETAPAATVKVPEEKPAEKPLQTSAAKLQPVADSYEKAHDDFLAWLKSVSDKLMAVDQKIDGLKTKITENEGRITKLKVDSAKSNAAQIRDLEDQTKSLWDQLKAEQTRQEQMSRALARAAEKKVEELGKSISDAVQKASAPLR